MTKILVRKVAQSVRTIRKSRDLSQEELADLSGLDRTYISGIERGVRNITLDSLESIVSALGMTVDEFLQILIKMDFD